LKATANWTRSEAHGRSIISSRELGEGVKTHQTASRLAQHVIDIVGIDPARRFEIFYYTDLLPETKSRKELGSGRRLKD
jgi:hypothetical protein